MHLWFSQYKHVFWRTWLCNFVGCIFKIELCEVRCMCNHLHIYVYKYMYDLGTGFIIHNESRDMLVQGSLGWHWICSPLPQCSGMKFDIKVNTYISCTRGYEFLSLLGTTTVGHCHASVLFLHHLNMWPWNGIVVLDFSDYSEGWAHSLVNFCSLSKFKESSNVFK